MKNLSLLITLFFCTSAYAADPVEVIPPQNKVLSSENGRYVFGQISSYRSDQYMLDTATGRLWQIVVDKDKNQRLQPVPVVQLLGEEAYIPEPQERDEAYRDMLRGASIEQMKKSKK